MLSDSAMKIERAKKHLLEYRDEVERWSLGQPFKVIPDDSEPAIRRFLLRIDQSIPDKLSTCIGDVVHNLRSALDCAATQLVMNAGHTSDSVLRETYFPVSDSEAKFGIGVSQKFLERVGTTTGALIRSLQPYKDGLGHKLWQLHRLDIIDKHRRIIPAASFLVQAEFLLPVPAINENGGEPSINTVFPLEDGMELFRTTFFQKYYHARASNFQFALAFNEIGIIVGVEVDEALQKYVVEVEKACDAIT